MCKCVFCDISGNGKSHLYSSEFFYVINDIEPIRNGHLLVVSKTHKMNFLELDEEHKTDLLSLVSMLIERIESINNSSVTLIGNNGILMDDNLHFHWHLIPRTPNDGFWANVF